SKPDLIGVYVNLMTKLNVLKMIKVIRQNLPQTKIILGGPEVRHHAENFLKHGADVIVIGEGEQTMLELCQLYSHPENSLNDVLGIAFLNEKKEMIGTTSRSNLR